MNLPLISIAITTFNGERYIKSQIESILKQTYKNLEIIICDDLSTDNTINILNEFKLKDSRIKLFCNTENLGFIKNFSKAISLCTGEYISLSDQDDIWEVNKIEKCYSEIKDNYLVCTNSNLIDENNNSLNLTLKECLNLKYIPHNKKLIFKHLIHQNFVQGSTIFAKASFLQNIKINNELFFHDHLFGIFASNLGKLKYLDFCSIKYRQHSNQITTNGKESLHMLSISQIDQQNDLILKCDKHIFQCKYLLSCLPCNKKYKKYINSTIKYYENMKDKNLYTLLYFIKNINVFYINKNIFIKLFFIIKRILGLLRYRLFLRKKIIQ